MGEAKSVPAAEAKARRYISEEELAKHNTDKDCWVAIHGLVIDIAKSLQNEHPGGPEVIFALAGKDVTEDFEDIGHSDAAREWADKLIIGYTNESKKEAMIPRNKELNGGEGTGGIGVLPLVLAVAAGVLAYIFYFQQ